MEFEYTDKEHLALSIKDWIDFMPESGVIVVQSDALRTTQQQSAIEVSCRQLAECLNEQGFDQKIVLPEIRASEVWWSQSTVKENLYKPLLKAMHNLDSTTQLNKVEPSHVYDKLCAVLITKLGLDNPPGFACAKKES